LTLRGVDGTGREKAEMGGIALTEPLKGGNTLFGSNDFVREDAGRGTERMLSGEQKVPVFVSRVGSEQEVAPSGDVRGRDGTMSA